MKKILLIIIFPIMAMASQRGEPVVMNSPIHPWYAKDGTDLIVNFSKINFDTRLVEMVRKHKEVKYPFINLSGKLDTITSIKEHTNGKNGTFNTKILTAKMHVTSIVTKNVIGHVAFKFKPHSGLNRMGVLLDRAFVTFDAHEYTPLFPSYITFGRLFMPFGTHKTFLLSEPITSVMSKVDGEMVKAGFQFSRSLKGATFISNDKVAGVDLKYNITMDKTKFDFNVSFINNNYQKTNEFNNKRAELKNVGPSLMPFISFEINKIGIRSEVLTALSKDKTKHPFLSGKVEGFYSFTTNGKFCSTALGYEKLFNTFITQPRYRINATFNTVFLPFTFTAFEIKLEKDPENNKFLAATIKFGVAY